MGGHCPECRGGCKEGKLKKKSNDHCGIFTRRQPFGFGDTLVTSTACQSMAVPVDELFDLLDSIGSHSALVTGRSQEVGLNQRKLKTSSVQLAFIAALLLSSNWKPSSCRTAALKAEEEARLFAEQVSAAAEAARIKAEEEATAAAALKAEEARLRAEHIAAAAGCGSAEKKPLRLRQEGRGRGSFARGASVTAAEAARIKAEEEAARLRL